MAGSFAKLVVSLGANVTSFETDMKRATSNQKRRMKEMEQQVQQAGRAIAVAFAAVATSTGAVVRSSIKAADEMQKLAQRTGLSTEALSEYKHVADLSGVSFEQFTNGMKRMQRGISDAEAGLSTQARAFERLGISTSELIKLSPDQQFERIAQAMTGLESATLRSATAQEIFGRAGTELLSVMSEGEAGIKAMRDEAARLGLTISTDFANQAAEFDDNISRMKAGFTGAANSLTAALLPALLDLQAYFMESDSNASDLAASIGEKLGGALKTIVAAFVIVKNAGQAFGRVLLGLLDLIAGLVQTAISPLTGALGNLAAAFAAFKSGDLAAAGEAIANIGKSIGEDFEAGIERVRNGAGFVSETIGDLGDGLEDVARVFSATGDAAGQSGSKFKDSGEAMSGASEKAKKLAADLEKARKAYADGKVWDDFAKRLKAAGEVIKETGEELDDLIKSQEELESSMKSLIDTLYPMEAATRTFVDQLGDLRQYAEDNAWSAERLADAEIRLANSFAEATRGIVDQKDKLSALDEGVRILERSFQSMWENILSGADNTWDSVLDGFRSLLARMIHEATTQKIVIGVQQAFGPGGGGVGDLFNMDFGGDLIAAAGVILGQSLAESDWGSIGSIALGIGGKWLGEQLGWWLGSLGGPLGLALGSALGAIIGDWVGGLFERKLAFTLGGENQRTRGDNQQISTPLGDILGLSGQGNFGSLNDPSSFGGQLAGVLTEFDTRIADFLKNFATDEQFASVTESLKNWTATFGEGADAADVLSSRFRVILGNFSSDIQEFVNGAADFEEQLDRFGVALTADKLLRENPELFSGRTTGDILNLVSAFQSGAETMEDAFKEFLTLFSRVVAVSDSLRSYASSNLADDFSALNSDMSLGDALARVNSEIVSAISNFDGSIESFEDIGRLAMLAREGELKLLAEIDAIQKGINSNLDKLKADILGVGAEDKTGEQLFLDAQKLIGQITDQSSAADIAAIEQQFNSIIRSMSPEDQLFMQSEILALIESFRARANPVLDMRRNEVLAEGERTRGLITEFMDRVGDPLDIIAGSLEGANLQETMDDGLDAIDASIQQIGPQVAAALAQGLSQVSFTINLDGGGLVTQ